MSIIQTNKILIYLIWTSTFNFLSERMSYFCSGSFATFGENILRMTVIYVFWYLYIHSSLSVDIVMKLYINPLTENYLTGTSTASFSASPMVLS